MTTEITEKPKFIDGVVKLHSQLTDAFNKAEKVARQLIGSFPSRNIFSIFIDFSEEQPTNKIKGYFTFKSAILRFLPIEFDKALLFPIYNHGGGNFNYGNGISIKEIDDMILNRSKILVRFCPIRDISDQILYNVKVIPTLIRDDFGKPFFKFPDIEHLSISDISSSITANNYTLVGKQYYAPFTKETEVNCVLFAQLDNEYDKNAIKVLRWLPSKKGIELDQVLGIEPNGGDVFFELGHVSRQENGILHSYMVQNDARLLFGVISDNQIRISGGIKLFQANDMKYPRCLYNIPLR